jgi:hypothetical protein
VEARSGRSPKEIVKEVVSRHIKARPRRISLRLYWEEGRSSITVEGDGSEQTVELPQAVSFASFAYGVLDAYREAYGDLEVVPISFREEVYRNGRVSLHLYPTGSEGVFDIFIKYE